MSKKYEEMDLFRSLSEEELAEVEELTEEQIWAALEQGRKDREAWEEYNRYGRKIGGTQYYK